MNESHRFDAHDNFSLANGGWLYQLLKRVDTGQKESAQITRRLLALVLIVWVPLLLLSLIQGFAFGGQVAEPLLNDLDTNVRLLLVAPLLIIAEFTVDPKLTGVIKQFINSNLVAVGEKPRFESEIHTTLRLRDSPWVEAVLVLVALAAAYQTTKIGLLDGQSSWLATPSGATEHLTIAGWWYSLVSSPIQRFLL